MKKKKNEKAKNFFNIKNPVSPSYGLVYHPSILPSHLYIYTYLFIPNYSVLHKNMFRTTIRRVSTKSIPHEPVPKNKYNQNRSVYNFKPVPTEGLVYNPPSAIVKPYMQTPYIFLPPNDPRREFAKQSRIDPVIVKEMPIIREFKAADQKEYNVTAETINKIKQLKQEEPARWTLEAISKEFNIELAKLHYFFRGESKKQVKSQPKVISKRLLDRQKRRELWLRNEY